MTELIDEVTSHGTLDGSDFQQRLRETIELLEAIDADRALLAQVGESERRRLLHAARLVFEPDTASRRRLVKATIRRRKAARVESDESVRAETGIRELRRKPVFTTPDVYPPPAAAHGSAEDAEPQRATAESQHCYVCKRHYLEIHHFYDQLCPPCAELNFFKRTESADLRGRVALLTGGRVKIGYQAGLKLLRAGAELIVSTRFPRDSAARYASEPDFADWSHRLEIFGLDLRHTPAVEAFCRHLIATRTRLDFIINNACQTVRRPAGFYEHMMELETAALDDLPDEQRKLLGSYEQMRSDMLAAGDEASPAALVHHRAAPAGLARAAELSQVALLPDDHDRGNEIFPSGMLDQDLQQIDLREKNSWRLLLAEVPTVELLEVQLVNAVAPFVFNARLKPLMLRTPGRDKHIVNVSAVEGQFYRRKKTTRHPHTNMAKAALNMMTRTAAADYHQDGIHMNSVDTGWVTDEDPAPIAARKVAEQRFHPPLDIIDGAARIVDPIISGINSGEHVWGQFLKDYQPTDW
jgi:NAD(P)-dependent dehydrogenase (short-subunit alcohol dehydrogenase family)